MRSTLTAVLATVGILGFAATAQAAPAAPGIAVGAPVELAQLTRRERRIIRHHRAERRIIRHERRRAIRRAIRHGM